MRPTCSTASMADRAGICQQLGDGVAVREGRSSLEISSAESTSAAAGPPGVMIETSRLRMRSLRDDDHVDLVGLAGNWLVARWLSTMPHPYAETDGREWIARVQEDHSTGQQRRFAIALKETDRLIGGVGLDGTTGDGSEEPAVGYWVGQPYWGNGYAREAVTAVIDYGFRTLGLSEGGITPGLAAVANAVVDALAEFGVEHIELPATPERIWRAIHRSRSQVQGR